MRRAHIWGWARTRRCDEPLNDLGPSSRHQSYPDCIIATHGYDFREGQGYCGAQDTFYVGNLKGMGRIYQQTFIDTYTKVSFAKLYDRKTPITAADLLNDRVLPF